jgi:hypothetical protein
LDVSEEGPGAAEFPVLEKLADENMVLRERVRTLQQQQQQQVCSLSSFVEWTGTLIR